MPRLDARRFNDEPQYTVVVGPCPGCDDWQLDYTDAVADSYAAILSLDPPQVTIQPFRDVVEHILQEHLKECPHLRDLVEEM